MTKKKTSYQNAGVDIEQANRLVKSISSLAKATHREGVLNGIGGFGALFELPTDRYQQPVLVSGTDGVGTKLKLAVAMNCHNTIGIDLVAMCVNDILTLGAEPLFFLDYFATGKLLPQQGKAILSGISHGCQLAGAALIGGETAEMPGVYHDQEYDLAGFCVGVVEKNRIIDGRDIQAGDQLIALASSGAHSNGYSLIRHVIAKNQIDLQQPFDDTCLGEVLLTPTRIYVSTIMQLMQQVTIKGMVHVTGGGLIENMPRILPPSVCAVVNRQSWETPTIFRWLQQQGDISDADMLTTFNMGVGMVLVVKASELQKTLQQSEQAGEQAWHLGEIQRRTDSQAVVIVQ